MISKDWKFARDRGRLRGMEASADFLSACFPKAVRYTNPWQAVSQVREPAGRFKAFPYSERHLQCVWSDASLRPGALKSHRGEEVVVEDPGAWNLEAGPDFVGAALRIGPERRRVRGDVEIHIHPSDWQRHGHGMDSNYSRVVAHVTFFSAPLAEEKLPAGCVQIALRDALAMNPAFAFESIDTTAYPYAMRAAVPPCSSEMSGWSAEEKAALLDAAGEERLRRKAERLIGAIAERGADQVLYEEVMHALGYKNNKSPFRRLAEIVTLDELRRSSAGDARAAYALLAGVAGLLPKNLRSEWDEETRRFVREVWDEWWKCEDEWGSQALLRSHWKLSGLRPMNHPLRRLMAAAQLFVAGDSMQLALDFAAAARRAHDGYWSFREGFAGKRSAMPLQLIGDERADAITINVITPFLAAIGKQNLFEGGLLDRLPVEGDNALLRQTAHHLFGPDHPAKLYATGRRRQGLLQIFHDYCLNDRSRCATCLFPKLLQAFRASERGAA